MITAQATIDLSALTFNYQQLKRQCQGKPLIAVIKGDAYGHGALQSAHALTMADMFAVSRIEEAIELRDAGIRQPIILLEGVFCRQDIEEAARYNLQLVIHHHQQLIDLEVAPLAQPLSVWLKIDTGMHRLGFHPYEVSDYVARLQASKNVLGEVGFVSHFSCADDMDNERTAQQLACFMALTTDYVGPKSLANSAGILYWPDAHCDWLRAGIALYGVAPNADQIGQDYGLQPVMTLRSRLIAVRDHHAGQPVGYGEAWSSPRDTRLGVVAMGYGDGYPRMVPPNTPVWINGRQVPIVGRISMDMLTVDLGIDAHDKPHDAVELWGRHLPIEHLAQHIGTIPYELMIKLTRRVAKTYQP